MKTLIVGGGNMGKSFARSFLDAHILRPNDLTVLEKNESNCKDLETMGFSAVYRIPDNYISNVSLIVLAVKPQDCHLVFETLKPFINSDHVILSIMAGVKLETIEKGLDTKKVVRSMPNLPTQIGMGMTAFTANEEVNRKELIAVQNLLSTTGKAIYFDDENMIDAATAISGSGPAFVYYFMNSMMKAARKMGFSESQADLLVWQTFIGSLHLQNKNSLSCQEWINKVASKGGTTEAALKVFKANDIEDGIVEGLIAAFNRAEELGNK